MKKGRVQKCSVTSARTLLNAIAFICKQTRNFGVDTFLALCNVEWVTIFLGATLALSGPRNIFIDREAREIIRLVASVCPSADAVTSEPFDL